MSDDTAYYFNEAHFLRLVQEVKNLQQEVKNQDIAFNQLFKSMFCDIKELREYCTEGFVVLSQSKYEELLESAE